jgi:hypothetical protein
VRSYLLGFHSPRLALTSRISCSSCFRNSYPTTSTPCQSTFYAACERIALFPNSTPLIPLLATDGHRHRGQFYVKHPIGSPRLVPVTTCGASKLCVLICNWKLSVASLSLILTMSSHDYTCNVHPYLHVHELFLLLLMHLVPDLVGEWASSYYVVRL